MKMKELCAEERPREKMALRGAKSLSHAELLAILIGSGVGGKNAVDVAQELLLTVEGRLGRLFNLSLDQLSRQKGIGPARAVSIAAALELGRRAFEETVRSDSRPLTDPEQVARLMLPQLRHLEHEECWLLMLNRAGLLIGKEMLSSGSDETTVLEPRQAIRKIVEKQAAAVILVHNHPGASPVPSEADIRETRRLRSALRPLDIPLLDHVILSDNAFYSFTEEKSYTMK